MAGEVAGQVSTISTAWAVFSVIGGSIIGGVISATVAFLTQKKTLDAAKAQRDIERFEKRQATAYSLFFKMTRMHSTLAIVDTTLTEFVEAGKKKGFAAYWQMILPLGNMPDRVKFTSEEMALLLSMDNKLFNELGPYDEVHNSLIELYENYGRRRTEVLSKFGADEMDGGTGTHSLTAEQIAWMKPRAYELDSLAQGMIERASKEETLSRSLLQRMHALFVKEFQFEKTLEFIQPSS
jgi:hypothetical protein